MTLKRKPQVSKSRSALVAAFRRLLMTRSYDDIHALDIALEADLSRSTFYGHFRNKNDIVRASMSGVISVLSEAGFPERNVARLTELLNHFRENLDLCKVFLNTSISAIAVELLAEEIQQRLLLELSEPDLVDSNAIVFTSIQAAEASLGLIRAWINDPAPVPADRIVNQINASASALNSLVIESNRSS